MRHLIWKIMVTLIAKKHMKGFSWKLCWELANSDDSFAEGVSASQFVYDQIYYMAYDA